MTLTLRRDANTLDVLAVERRGVPKWLQLNKDGFEGKLVSLPSREDLTMPIREQLIVELYSR